MKKRSIALICIVLGSLFLSIELFLLKVVQLLDRSATGSWHENAMLYAIEFPCNIAFAITISVIIFSCAALLVSKHK